MQKNHDHAGRLSSKCVEHALRGLALRACDCQFDLRFYRIFRKKPDDLLAIGQV